MPNYCNYSMKVRGFPANVGYFIECMKRIYYYSDSNCYEQKYFHAHPGSHMFRIFETIIDGIEPFGEDLITAQLSGYCAWSVFSCMLTTGKPGELTVTGSYYDSNVHHLLNGDESMLIDGKFYGTHLLELANTLNLFIEVYSMEPGLCFQEHYIIDNFGNYIACEETTYHEYYTDYDSYEEAMESYECESEDDMPYSREEYKNTKDSGIYYIGRGGYEWNFDGIKDDQNVMVNIVRNKNNKL